MKKKQYYNPFPARYVVLIVLALGWISISPPITAQNEAETAESIADRKRKVDHLLDDLRDPRLELVRRRRAAAILLDERSEQATAAMRRLLIDSDDVTVKRAIALGIVDAADPPLGMIQPLVDLIGVEDAALRTDIAAALGKYSGRSMVQLLIDAAVDEQRESLTRLGAIEALSHHRTKESANTLMLLAMQAQKGSAIRAATFDALGHFTGLFHLEDDLQAWQRWWNRAKSLTDDQWMREMIRTVAIRNADLQRRSDQLSRRLRNAHQQHYDSATEENRPAIIHNLLSDDLELLRLLGIRIIEQRLLNSQRVAESTRQALREKLTDRAPGVRRQAAIVLEAFADEKAIELATEILAFETDPTVIAAFLRLVEKAPTAEAIDHTLRFLADPQLQGNVAGFLVTVHAGGLLTEVHAGQTREEVLRLIKANAKTPALIPPAFVQLLGALGVAEDEAVVAGFLRSNNIELRTAAIQAYRVSKWKIDPLLDSMNDSRVRIEAWRAVAQRVENAKPLAKVIASEPQEDVGRNAWLEAMVAVSGRMTLPELIEFDSMYREQTDKGAVYEIVLKSAAGLKADGTAMAEPALALRSAELRTEAELLLSEYYLRLAEPAKAKPVLSRIVPRRSLLTTKQMHRLDLARLNRMLQQRAFDEANEHTKSLLEVVTSPPASQLATLWLDAMESAIDTEALDNARNLSGKFQTLFNGRMEENVKQRLNRLSTRIPAPAPAVEVLPQQL